MKLLGPGQLWGKGWRSGAPRLAAGGEAGSEPSVAVCWVCGHAGRKSGVVAGRRALSFAGLWGVSAALETRPVNAARD